MARPKNSRNTSAPKYRKHSNGKLAFVEISGKRHYLGRYGSPESKQKYNRLIARRERSQAYNGDVSLKTIGPDPTISELAVEYVSHCKQYYRKQGKPTSEYYVAKTAIKKLRGLFGSTFAMEFGSREYVEVQEALIGNLLDVSPFADVISEGKYQYEADINWDGTVDLLDVEPFVNLLGN